MNISVKLFANLISVFLEDFSKNFFMSIGASSPHSPDQCLMRDQNFANILIRSHRKNISVNFFQDQTSGFSGDFLRICSVQEIPMFIDRSKFREQFLKRVA